MHPLYRLWPLIRSCTGAVSVVHAVPLVRTVLGKLCFTYLGRPLCGKSGSRQWRDGVPRRTDNQGTKRGLWWVWQGEMFAFGKCWYFPHPFSFSSNYLLKHNWEPASPPELARQGTSDTTLFADFSFLLFLWFCLFSVNAFPPAHGDHNDDDDKKMSMMMMMMIKGCQWCWRLYWWWKTGDRAGQLTWLQVFQNRRNQS